MPVSGVTDAAGTAAESESVVSVLYKALEEVKNHQLAGCHFS